MKQILISRNRTNNPLLMTQMTQMTNHGMAVLSFVSLRLEMNYGYAMNSIYAVSRQTDRPNITYSYNLGKMIMKLKK